MAIGKGLIGQVCIGIVFMVVQFFLPVVAQQLLVEAFEVMLRTIVGFLDMLKLFFCSGEIDLMVGIVSALDEGFTFKVIAEDAIVVAVSVKYELLRGTFLLKDLVGYCWVL